jgi:hypothetical protein
MTERLDLGEEPGNVSKADIAQTQREQIQRRAPGEDHPEFPGGDYHILDSETVEDHLAYYMTVTQHIEWLDVESFRVHDEWKIAGTADRIGRDRDTGAVQVYDLKTGGLHPQSMAMQLAMYARMTPYNVATEQRTPKEEGMDLGTAIIIHMPIDRKDVCCNLWEIDINKGLGANNTAHSAWTWRSSKQADLMTKMAPWWERESQLEKVGK